MDLTYQLTLGSTSYLWGSLLLLPVWAYGFWKNKNVRKEMILCGILFGLASIVIGYTYSNKDYWDPPYIFNNILHVEDFIYGFLFGGISSEIFEILLGFKNVKKKRKQKLFLVPVFIIICALCFYIFVNILGRNSIIAHIVPPLVVGLFAITLRRDFLVPTFLSGIFILILTFIWQSVVIMIYPSVITDIWNTENLSQIFIYKIPIEELIFAFALGFGASSFYELILGYEYKK